MGLKMCQNRHIRFHLSIGRIARPSCQAKQHSIWSSFVDFGFLDGSVQQQKCGGHHFLTGEPGRTRVGAMDSCWCLHYFIPVAVLPIQPWLVLVANLGWAKASVFERFTGQWSGAIFQQAQDLSWPLNWVWCTYT